ncbi:hypothetical protein JZ751_029311 [Albula glossodonta]|uniref:Uncharacterized protein n=1 Tax=Albula glossodonta TaxID=121402 RepID=A0A8T2P8P9_9TELE|nr:hypothetical protein JZ751_029311 [Albula glossodonta]
MSERDPGSFHLQVSFTLNEELTTIDSIGEKSALVRAPREHPFTMQTVGGQTLAVFTETSSDMDVSVWSVFLGCFVCLTNAWLRVKRGLSEAIPVMIADQKTNLTAAGQVSPSSPSLPHGFELGYLPTPKKPLSAPLLRVHQRNVKNRLRMSETIMRFSGLKREQSVSHPQGSSSRNQSQHLKSTTVSHQK